jgi:glycine betaine/proline transport system ATP-binding protein
LTARPPGSESEQASPGRNGLAEPANGAAIVAENASKIFLDGTVVAFSQLSLAVRHQEILCIVGPSGCGKTTLLRCIAGLTDLSGGKLVVHGRPVAGPPEGVAMVFQHFGLLPWKTVHENAAFGLAMAGTPNDVIRERVAHYLDLVGLVGFERHYPYQLSGGMQQRVGLARAFAVNPTVMLYDEPFSALDPLIRRDMQDEVIRLQYETGKTMVFITHDLPEALRLGDRIAIMRDGAIVQLGTPEELVGSPADEYVANFVRDIPRSHVLTLRWIMRDAHAGEEDGPRLDVRTTVRSAVRVIVASERPVCAVDEGRVVGVVDKEAVLTAIAGES